LGGDVEVPEDDERFIGIARRVQAAPKTLEPLELGEVVLAVDLPAVGHVDARRPHALACRPEKARLGDLVLGLVGEAGDDVVEADAAEDRHTVPLPLSAVRRLVAEGGERHRREVGVGQLGLLQAQHVGLGVAEPLLDARHALVQRVDVPGRDPHLVGSLRSPWWTDSCRSWSRPATEPRSCASASRASSRRIFRPTGTRSSLSTTGRRTARSRRRWRWRRQGDRCRLSSSPSLREARARPETWAWRWRLATPCASSTMTPMSRRNGSRRWSRVSSGIPVLTLMPGGYESASRSVGGNRVHSTRWRPRSMPEPPTAHC